MLPLRRPNYSPNLRSVDRRRKASQHGSYRSPLRRQLHQPQPPTQQRHTLQDCFHLSQQQQQQQRQHASGHTVAHSDGHARGHRCLRRRLQHLRSLLHRHPKRERNIQLSLDLANCHTVVRVRSYIFVFARDTVAALRVSAADGVRVCGTYTSTSALTCGCVHYVGGTDGDRTVDRTVDHNDKTVGQSSDHSDQSGDNSDQSSDHFCVLAGTSAGEVLCWRLRRPGDEAQCRRFLVHKRSKAVTCVKVLHRAVLTASADHTLKVWRFPSVETVELKLLVRANAKSTVRAADFLGARSPVSPSQCVSEEDGVWSEWLRHGTAESRRRDLTPTSVCRLLCFCEDGFARLFAIKGDVLWRTCSVESPQRPLLVSRLLTRVCTHLHVSPVVQDVSCELRQRIALCSSDGELRVLQWRCKSDGSGEDFVPLLQLRRDAVAAVALLHTRDDDIGLAVASDDGAMQLWDTVSDSAADGAADGAAAECHVPLYTWAKPSPKPSQKPSPTQTQEPSLTRKPSPLEQRRRVPPVVSLAPSSDALIGVTRGGTVTLHWHACARASPLAQSRAVVPPSLRLQRRFARNRRGQRSMSTATAQSQVIPTVLKSLTWSFSDHIDQTVDQCDDQTDQTVDRSECLRELARALTHNAAVIAPVSDSVARVIAQLERALSLRTDCSVGGVTVPTESPDNRTCHTVASSLDLVHDDTVTFYPLNFPLYPSFRRRGGSCGARSDRRRRRCCSACHGACTRWRRFARPSAWMCRGARACSKRFNAPICCYPWAHRSLS
ncbi:MAG: hypothetical protein MHM6MM_003417 [Cercozoa sp. M6MM]